MEAEIRALGASDLRAVAEVHLAAYRDSALSALGLEAVRRYYAWQLSSARTVAPLGAFRGSSLAGFCVAGEFPAALRGYLRQNRGYLAWRVLTHPWLLGAELFRRQLGHGLLVLTGRGRAAVARDAATSPRSFNVLSIAVHPREARGGLGRRLMAETERVARERGYPCLGLTVRPENAGAVAFYEALGFVREPPGPGWLGQMYRWL